MDKSGISVESMRRIDRVGGIPLCALASVFLTLWWRLRRKPPRPIRNVLFVELSEKGSAILAEPAMRKAHESIGAEIYFTTFAHNADSLAITGTVTPAKIFSIKTSSIRRLVLDTLAFLLWARRNEIDTVIDLELFSRFSGLLTGLSGADRRIGFHRFYSEGLFRGEMLTHRVMYNAHIHIAKNFLALVNALLSTAPTVPYSKTIITDEELTLSPVPPSAAACERVTAQIIAASPSWGISRRRLVLINPNTSDMLPQRRWMALRYVELTRLIVARYSDVLVLITGAASERAEVQKLVGQCASDRCIAFAGQTSLADLPALYALANVMVSNDSGAAHFAAACGLPTIVLFGPETPSLYRPLGNSTAICAGLACSPCVSAANHRKSPCTDNACMRAISVEQVFGEVNQVLMMRLPLRA